MKCWVLVSHSIVWACTVTRQRQARVKATAVRIVYKHGDLPCDTRLSTRGLPQGPINIAAVAEILPMLLMHRVRLCPARRLSHPASHNQPSFRECLHDTTSPWASFDPDAVVRRVPGFDRLRFATTIRPRRAG